MGFRGVVLAAMAFAVIAGCGGSGGGSGASSGTRASREQVLQLLENGMRNSEMIRNDNDGSDRGRGPKLKKSKITRSHETGFDFWYDEFYELWVEWVPGDENDPTVPSGHKLWEDHEKTKPAGHELTWGSAWDVMPMWFEEDYKYLAGPMKGIWFKSRYEMSETGGSVTGSGFEPEYGGYEYSGSWGELGFGKWTEKFTFLDGSWHQYIWTEKEDFSFQLIMKSSIGVTVTMDFTSDFSGSGSITGSGDGLPATLTWDVDGNGLIKWSDGTETEFNAWDFML